MKGNEKLVETLNALLADELTAINQYMVHSEMCDDWGYEKLHKSIEARAITEMKHAEALIGRILFLEGKPVVSELNEIHIGDEVPAMMTNDLGAEMRAIKAYNQAVQLAAEVGDHATKQLLEGILKDEDEHLDDIEQQRDEIEQMGLQIYLTTKL